MSFTRRFGPVCAALLLPSALLAASGPTQPDLGTRSVPILQIDGLQFRDLDRNGRLDPYEDWRLSPEVRAKDLLKRMSLSEKAGVMVHGTARAVGNPIGVGTSYDLPGMEGLVGKGVVNFVTRLAVEPAELARQDNSLQEIAERARWAVPLTISSDPRNQFEGAIGMSVPAVGFSVWPDPLGFAAIGDADITRAYGDIVRQEYKAVGIRQALSPQADLATEPRWSRIFGTFGEDADLAGRMVAADIVGLQGSDHGVTRDGVLAVVKHWVGYGASDQGWDSHNYYGRYARFTGPNLDYHIKPFRSAFGVGVADVMPTYSILTGLTLDGKPLEQVGANFSHQLLTDLLRKREGFKGVVLSDWAVTEDCPTACMGHWAPGTPPVLGMPWGVQQLSKTDRFAKAINAGVDEVGGTEESERIVEAVKNGKIKERRIDEAALKILLQKFQLGLFENPYADPALAARIVGNAQFLKAADDVQARSLVLLQNSGNLLPLKSGTRVYLAGFHDFHGDADGLAITSSPDDADVIIVRAPAPFKILHKDYFIGSMQEEGDLSFDPDGETLSLVKKYGTKSKIVAVIRMSRPAVLTGLIEHTSGVIAEFGISEQVLVDVIAGKRSSAGTLPFELPRSDDAVRAQAPDLPHDSASPLFPIHFGLRDLAGH